MRPDEAEELLGGVVQGDGFKAGVAMMLRAQGWTQLEIARELVVGQSTVSRWLGLVREAVESRGGGDLLLGAGLLMYRSWMDRRPA